MGFLDRFSSPAPLALWGSVDGQLESSGHTARAQDLDRFASLGVRAIRYPVP